jgi:hypothetical protein
LSAHQCGFCLPERHRLDHSQQYTLGGMTSRALRLLIVEFSLSRSVVAGDPLSMNVVPMMAIVPATLRVRAEAAPEEESNGHGWA